MVGVWPNALECDANVTGSVDKPDLPHAYTGEPQRADGAARNTPPTAFRLSPSCRTREAPPGMPRSMGSREGGKRLPERSMPQSVTQMKEEWRKGRSSLRTGKPSTRWVRGVKEHPNGEGP